MARPSKTSAPHLTAAELKQRIVRLRIGGASYRAIADETGKSHAYAHKVVSEYLDAINRDARATVEHWRDIHVERLELLVRELMPLVVGPRPKGAADDDGPNLWAVDRLVKLLDRQAKLLGLDKPAGLELSGPNGQPIPASVEAAFAEVYGDETVDASGG